jgi:hypothetical protein
LLVLITIDRTALGVRAVTARDLLPFGRSLVFQLRFATRRPGPWFHI